MQKFAQNSAKAFEHVFDYARPSDWKEILWKWYSSTVTSSYHKNLTRREKVEINTAFELLYRAMQKLIEENKE